MHRSSRFALLVVVIASFCVGEAYAREPLSYEEKAARIGAAAQAPWIEVEEIGESIEGRPLYLVHLSHGKQSNPWSLLFFGQQHGNEPAGSEALVDLITTIAGDPSALPEDVDLWIVPVVNPDGAERNQRRNAAEADLNRDHLLLAQPETLALHEAVRKVMPHVIVDCHEFTRDSSAYTDKGWFRWPVITMGTANHPFLPREIFEVGLEWVESARAPMAEAGIDYDRYMVGGAPPHDEIRPSTLEANDGRNGLASLGNLGFIIESGRFGKAEEPNGDLDLRVKAYTLLLRRFLDDHSLREASLAAVAKAGQLQPQTRVPSNFFWGNAGARTASMRVTQIETGETLEIDSGNIMHDRIVKTTAALPAAYAISAAQAGPYAALLDRHGISYKRLSKSVDIKAEGTRLVRVEAEDDPLYERYGGRQIVEPEPEADRSFARGALIVPIAQPLGYRVVQLLEPRLLYGLYQYPEFQETVSFTGTIPVWRLSSMPSPTD